MPTVARSGSGRRVSVVLYEYRTVIPCGQNTPDSPAQDECQRASTGCTDPKTGTTTGSVWVFRRATTPGKPPGAWNALGSTCFDDAVPRAGRGLDLAALQTAFARTPFAKPGVSTQPVGGRTLVGLPTSFQVAWPQTGYRPGQTRDLTLAGVPVRIRPTLVSYEYDFGDGTTSGPTTSPGGTYPDGDVTHPYERKGTYATSVTTTYAGQVSIAGSDFLPLPGTATVTGPRQTLTVLTAKNRLVIH